jgi:hypothetical protein
MPGGVHPPLETLETWHFNYVNPETGGFYIVVLVGVLLGLAYLAVILRLVSRLYFQRNFGIDDGLIVANMVRRCYHFFFNHLQVQLKTAANFVQIPLTGMAVGIILGKSCQILVARDEAQCS